MSLPRLMTQVDLDTIDAYASLQRITAWPTTRRRQRRERVARNRAIRAWRLDIGRERRAALRIDPPGDYDEIPF